jgi:hypothetical protein
MMCHLLNLDDGTLHCTLLKSRMCITVSHWRMAIATQVQEVEQQSVHQIMIAVLKYYQTIVKCQSIISTTNCIV